MYAGPKLQAGVPHKDPHYCSHQQTFLTDIITDWSFSPYLFSVVYHVSTIMKR